MSFGAGLNLGLEGVTPPRTLQEMTFDFELNQGFTIRLRVQPEFGGHVHRLRVHPGLLQRFPVQPELGGSRAAVQPAGHDLPRRAQPEFGGRRATARPAGRDLRLRVQPEFWLLVDVPR